MQNRSPHSRNSRIAWLAVFAIVYQLGACSCGCLEHNVWGSGIASIVGAARTCSLASSHDHDHDHQHPEGDCDHDGCEFSQIPALCRAGASHSVEAALHTWIDTSSLQDENFARLLAEFEHAAVTSPLASRDSAPPLRAELQVYRI